MPIQTRTALENLLDNHVIADHMTTVLTVETLPVQGHVAAEVYLNDLVRKAEQIRTWQKHGIVYVSDEQDALATHIETYAPHVDMTALAVTLQVGMAAVRSTHLMYSDANQAG